MPLRPQGWSTEVAWMCAAFVVFLITKLLFIGAIAIFLQRCVYAT